MNRSAVFVLLGLAAAGGRVDAASTAARPNVLFIAIDDLNDWVGCLGGHPNTRTPNIDRLARRGTVFTNAECGATACLPSRCALMTGRFPASTGLYTNYDGSFRKYPDLRDSVTIPQYFARHGYHTMGVGKVLHTPRKVDFQTENDVFRPS